MQLMAPRDVTDETSLMEYARQRFGCPCHIKDQVAFRKNARVFFTNNPHIGIAEMVVVVDWCRATNRRPSRLAEIFRFTNDAFRAGVIVNNEKTVAYRVTEQLFDAMAVEQDYQWRHRLMAASESARPAVLAQWRLANAG